MFGGDIFSQWIRQLNNDSIKVLSLKLANHKIPEFIISFNLIGKDAI
jgi:hypothetical protein